MALLAGRSARTLLTYLAALDTGRPVLLVDPAQHADALNSLLLRYEPVAVLCTRERVAAVGKAGVEPPDGYRRMPSHWVLRTPRVRPAPHPELCLLLATSGSTGSPRLVRLSRAAVRANARSVAEALDIGPGSVAVTGLPLFYGYGLAVVHTHLLAGGTLVVSTQSPMTAGYWHAVDRHHATTFDAVPATYEMLRRLRWNPTDHASLRCLTQAGGRMRPALAAELHATMVGSGRVGLYLMYGQTEATARMAVLPPDRLARKAGSVGPAVPGGRFTIEGDDEVVYHGPNVMMGYADRADDLARGDDLGGVLHTGDRGHLDDEGYLFLTGRSNRLGKVMGIRVDLTEVETAVQEMAPSMTCPVAAVCADDRLSVWCETGPGTDATDWVAFGALLADRLRLPRRACFVRAVERFPLLPTGKVDYRALEAASC
ncbi:AMP-binding protein [Streptomyces sp. BE230]|uniref:AMP-binding protein n=1 Tax=Streptomyces sp. BE230 TaxID=3002526 RepID=UPI002ED6A249|nr:AMP-binding protein [Streptomyces sp. BE230]